MRYEKLICATLIFSITLYGSYCFVRMKQAEKNNIEQYYEKTPIVFKIDGKDSSLSKYNYFPENYNETFQELNRIYHSIALDLRVMDYDVAYFLGAESNMLVQPLLLAGCDEESMMFEIKESSLLEYDQIHDYAIISDQIRYIDGTEVQIGDQIQIVNPYLKSSNDSSVLLEVIGIAKTQKDYVEEERAFIWVSNETILKITEKWKQNTSPDLIQLSQFYIHPGIMSPIYKCASEHDYDQIQEAVKAQMDRTSVKYEIIRLDDHMITNKNEAFIYKQRSILSLMSVIFIVVIIFVLKKINAAKEMKTQKMIMEQQEVHTQNMIAMNEQIHRIKHDMKHFLDHLDYLIEEKDYKKLKSLLQVYRKDIESVGEIVYTNNKTINALLHHYMNRAKKENVDFVYSGVVDLSFEMSDHKLYLLLSNALDNAFLHQNDHKVVKMKIEKVNQYIRMNIMNPTKLHSFNESKIKQSEDHGFGIKSMKQIVQEANGRVLFDVHDHWFSITILIPSKDDKKITE